MKKKYSNKYLIDTGIGLQDVDGLKNSAYFIAESKRYIKGEITIDELDTIIDSYYKQKPNIEDRSKEADKVASRIAKIISEDSFTFTVGQFMTIHRILFDGIIENAGRLRSYNFSKKEWVLDGASVIYGDFRELEMTLQYDFDLERHFRYNHLTIDEIIEHLATFIANLWQIHAFEEGNTRTTAVFTIKYLRSLGFDVTNDTFAKNAWYFRNALVRANYNNFTKGIQADSSFLIKFLRNLLLGENNALKNRDLHIEGAQEQNNNFKSKSIRKNKVVELIRKNPNIKSEEIAKQIGVSVRTIKSLLVTLENESIIKRVNGKRYGYWIVIN